ncbi:hypothetical protein Gotur_026087 [Gossypium turneri]
MELRASLDKIEQMKRRMEELEVALQGCEIDHIMGEAVTQIREVADYL